MSLSKLRGTRIVVGGLVAASLLCCAYAPAGASTTTTTEAGTTPATVENLLHNGNFALPFSFSGYSVRPPGYYKYNKQKLESIPGWTVGAVTDPSLKNSAGAPDFEGGVTVYCRCATNTAPPGSNQLVMLYNSGPGSVSQVVSTIPGLSYKLSWFGAGYPGSPLSKTMNVMWDNKIVALPVYSTAGSGWADVVWKMDTTVVLANSSSSVLEFVYDPSCQGSACNNAPNATFVSEVTLNGDAQLYLPASVTLPPTGPLLAVVRSTTGTAFTDPNLTVKLEASWEEKIASYAPPILVNKLIATATVVNSVATLEFQGIPTSEKGKTITGTATLSGPGFITQTKVVKIKIS